MGASSVTGVSGAGSVDGLSKGSEHMSLGVAKLIGPKIINAGTITLTGTTGTVQFPAPNDVITNYMVLLTSNSNALSYVSTALAAVTNTSDWNFIITGGSGAVVNYAIVKIGKQ